MQPNLYPKGPIDVPLEITNPSKSFKKHILIASASLILFMAIYIGLSGWFLYKSYQLLANTFTGGRDGFLSFIGGALLGFLGIFMVKALFFRTKNEKDNSIEITKEDEPQLFNFINKIADEVKAPRPHKIFLSNRVNAAVFYDLSIINLIFPTKKNLEIGLGLVNTLDLGEFKSIIAHEFGHFAQKSMIIGRWVYVANRIAQHIVAKRDAFDTFLNGISNVDIRIAWIGWLLSIIVWSIRSVSETLFTLVLITQRALSREMEFHADLVAVSVTGSDAIVHSLYKLQAADEAFDKAIEFIDKQLANKKIVGDIYAIQSNSIKHISVVLNDPGYGASPKPLQTGGNGSGFRIFKDQIAQTPKMWSTHPSNIDREKNAKKIYIKSEIDERSPWILFRNPDELKNKSTLNLYNNIQECSMLSNEESLALHDVEFQRSFLLPKYRGVYLNRSIFLNASHVDEVYSQDLQNGEIPHQFTMLYPPDIQHQLSTLKNLDEEVDMLEGIKNKTLDISQKKIYYRNSEIDRSDLPAIISQAKIEAQVERDKIEAHDRLCRNVYYAAAKNIGNGWPEYLRSVTGVVLFCEHLKKNIQLHSQHFYETLAVSAKIKNISSNEIFVVLRAANNFRSAIESVFTKAPEIQLSQAIIGKMGGLQVSEMLEPFELGLASHDNINSWISVVDSWTDLAYKALNSLHEASLDELLQTEQYIQDAYHASPENVKQAPDAFTVPDDYLKYDPKKTWIVDQKPDLFSRFYHGDGIFHSLGRLAVAASIIFFAIFITSVIGNTKIVIYNGLPEDVKVNIGDKHVWVTHDNSKEIEIDNVDAVEIKTTTESGELIESFTVQMGENSRNYVYNVAHAAVMYTWLAYYGYGSGSSDNDYTILGNPRWSEVNVDYYFEEPPQTISSKSSDTKKVVTVFDGHPSQIVGLLTSLEDKSAYINVHAIHEKSDSPHILSWLSMAANLPSFPSILEKRLARDPSEIVSLRMQQDYYQGDEKKKICKEYEARYKSNPDNPDFYYLNCRCIEDQTTKDDGFITGYRKWNDNPWLAMAAGYTFVQREQWADAIECYSLVTDKLPALNEIVLEEMKRICHYTNNDSLVPSPEQSQLTYLMYVQAAENSDEYSNSGAAADYSYAYKLLSQGRLNEALEYSKPDSDIHYMMIRLAAVSDNAKREIINTALSLDTLQGFNATTYAPTLGLLAKNNKSTGEYRSSLKSLIGDGADSVYHFIDLVKSNNIAEADKSMGPLSAELKGKLSLIGIIILDDKAPAKWKKFASGLLFITEKPYLRDTEKLAGL